MRTKIRFSVLHSEAPLNLHSGHRNGFPVP